MTTCGIWWTIGLVVLCVIGIILGEARPAAKKTPNREQEKPRREKETGPADEPLTIVFRRAEQKIVTCHACTDMRRGYTVSFAGADADEEWARTLEYEKKALACTLAEQALAAGGVAYRMENGILHAELRAIAGEAEP